MATDDEPAWLSAWRSADAPAQPAQPGHQPRTATGGRGSSTSTTASTTAAAQRFSAGFSEPTPWTWDGGKRREAVYDVDHNPPRFVRRVGWRICVTCARPFWSEHVVSVRMCNRCKAVPE